MHMYAAAAVGACPDDEQLAIEVELALVRRCPWSVGTVSVSAREGVVHLRGSVGSERKLVCMYKAARTVAGIRWVCNDVVTVRPASRVHLDLAAFLALPAAG